MASKIGSFFKSFINIAISLLLIYIPCYLVATFFPHDSILYGISVFYVKIFNALLSWHTLK
jgi:hypothetical protein